MTFLYILLVIISLLLMVTILMQSSKGGGLAGAFGGGASQANALFGGSGAGNFLTKATSGLAIAFMVLIMLIGVLNKGGTSDVDDFQRELQEEMIVPGTKFEVANPAEMALPGEAVETPAAPATETTEDE